MVRAALCFMRQTRHRLTQLTCALALLGGAACDSMFDAGDADAAIDGASFKLCDGSNDVRLGYQSGGGFVDEGYGFERPYGFEFLFVDGHCDFIVAKLGEESPGSFTQGHLSDDAAAELTQRLELGSLPRGVYFDNEACPDAGSVSLATPYYYGDCVCGCDDAPDAFERALSAIGETLSFVRAQGSAASGEVELAARMHAQIKAGTPVEWPFDWPLAEIDNVTLNDNTVRVKTRTLAGSEARTARDLFAETRTSSSNTLVTVESNGSTYRLFLRERTNPELAKRIAKFQLDTDPRTLHPVAACQDDPEQTASFRNVSLDRQRLYTWLDSGAQCGLRICWDGEFQTKQPVVAPLRIVEAKNSPPCLSTPRTSYQLDLTPIVDAFHTSYPSAKLEVELSLPGFSAHTLKLTE